MVKWNFHSPSSMRPEPLTPYISFPLARGPGHCLSTVVNATAGPEITPSVANGDATEKQGFLVVVKGHCVTSLKPEF